MFEISLNHHADTNIRPDETVVYGNTNQFTKRVIVLLELN